MSWTLTLDIKFTRRLVKHELRNENGDLVSTHQRVGEAIAWAIERDIRRLEVISQDGHWLMDLEPFPW